MLFSSCPLLLDSRGEDSAVSLCVCVCVCLLTRTSSVAMKVSIGKWATALPALLLATTVSAVSFHRSGMEVGPIEDDATLSSVVRRADGPTNGWGEFDQLIDHENPQLGTFKQRYWYGTQYWNGTGSPIVITTPGEQAADGFK